jgi:hypothetical protein
MELRSIPVTDADGVKTIGYTLQGFVDLGTTTYGPYLIGSFPDLASSAAIGAVLDTYGSAITYSATNHDPFSI